MCLAAKRRHPLTTGATAAKPSRLARRLPGRAKRRKSRKRVMANRDILAIVLGPGK